MCLSVGLISDSRKLREREKSEEEEIEGHVEKGREDEGDGESRRKK